MYMCVCVGGGGGGWGGGGGAGGGGAGPLNPPPYFKSQYYSSRKHAYVVLTPLNPILFSKTGVYSGIQFISAQKHRL